MHELFAYLMQNEKEDESRITLTEFDNIFLVNQTHLLLGSVLFALFITILRYTLYNYGNQKKSKAKKTIPETEEKV